MFRDLAILKQADVPLELDTEQQRYRIPGTYFLSPTAVTAEESLAIAILCNEFGSLGKALCIPHAKSAGTKFENALSGPVRDYLRSVCGSIEIKTRHRTVHSAAETYQQLVDAIAQKRSVRLQYSGCPDTLATKLSPYRLVFYGRHWYVIGRSSLHRSTRIFNVSRILALEGTQDRYRVPRNFGTSRFFRRAWVLIPEARQRWKVLIKFEQSVAQNVANHIWHQEQKLEFNDDGTLNFSVSVDGLNEISWWVLGFGNMAEVIQPRELREIIKAQARDVLRKYGCPSI